jgi:SAM-dependent methyltransferase
VGGGSANDMAPPRDFHRRWPTLQPPLRPPVSVAAQIAQALGSVDDPILLLGVTPELAGINRAIVAVDWNPRMIALAWPGDTADRHALLGDWKAMPLADASVGGAMGDGALTMLDWPGDAERVLAELHRVVRPGGRVAIRCFATPVGHPDVAAICAEALSGARAFHAFKLRFNMAVARERDGIAVASATLFARFCDQFPDRARLAAASGWSPETIAEIDAYRDSGYIHCYPSRDELTDLVSAHWPGRFAFAETGGYPVADHCPLLLLDRP